MRWNKSVLLGQRSGRKSDVLLGQRIHFLLQDFGVLLQPHLGVPWVHHVMAGILDFLPRGGMVLLETGDQLFRLWRELQFRVGGGKQQNMRPSLAQLRSLFFNGGICAKKNQHVDSNERQRDNRQAPSRHILVFDGEKHTDSPLVRRTAIARKSWKLSLK